MIFQNGIGQKRISIACTRLILAIILLAPAYILAVPAMQVSAAVTTEVSKYFYTDDTFTLNEKIGVVNVNSYDEIVIDYDGDIIVVKNGTCQRVINNDFCVNVIEYDLAEKEKKANLIVYYVGPDVTMVRNINNSNPLVGEGVRMSVELSNEGNTTADDVLYTDIFPSEIEVVRVDSGLAKTEKMIMGRNDTSWKNMTRVIWRGDIRPGKKEIFSYILKPITSIDAPFSAKMVYNDGINDIETISSSLRIETESFFGISKKYGELDYTVEAGSTDLMSGESKGEFQVGEEGMFIIELKNMARKNETINATVDMYLDERFIYEGPIKFRVYTNASDLNRSYTPGVQKLQKLGNNYYRWNGLVNPDNIHIASKIKAAREGTARITVTASMVQFDEKKSGTYVPLYEQSYYGYEDIDVELTDPEMKSNFNDGQTFESGESAYFTVYMQNPNEYANFTNMRLNFDSPWLKKNVTYRNLKKTNYINFFDGFVTMPVVDKQLTEKIYANLTYETEYGEVRSQKFEKSIVIKPHSPVQISRSFTPARGITPEKVVLDHGEITVSLRLTNLGTKKIDHINVTEIVDPQLGVKENFTRVMNLPGSIVMDVLQYKINTPDIKDVRNYRITSYVDYSTGNETYHLIKDSLIEVNTKNIAIGVKKLVKEDILSRGMPMAVDYEIENTAGEDIENVTIIFPPSEHFETIGSRIYSIERMGKGEKVTVNSNERLMPKTNGSIIKLEKTSVVFHDAYGNQFGSNSTTPTVEILYLPINSPAMQLSRNLSAHKVNQTEKITVTTTIMNIGSEKAKVKIDELNREWEAEIEPGRNKSLSYSYSTNRIGTIELPPTTATYTYEGRKYYSYSNSYSNPDVIEVVVLETPEEKQVREDTEAKDAAIAAEPPAAEEAGSPYAKYVYLIVFMVIICIVILSVIRVKPKESRFDFLER